MTLTTRLFAVGVTAGGMFAFACGCHAYWERHQAQRWLDAQAVVESSAVCSWRGARGSTSYMPRVTYTYWIGNEIHHGDAVRFGPSVVDRAEAEQDVRRFARGMQAIAYVDPDDHSHAVLDRDHLTGAVKWAIGTSLFVIVADLGLFAVLRAIRA